MYILGPREAYLRRVKLPAGWKKVRVGVAMSFTNLVSDNGTPNSEVLPFNSGNAMLNDLYIGFTNGVSYPGQVGNRFVGLGGSAQTSTNIGIQNPGAGWKLSSDGAGAGTSHARFSALFSDGTTITRRNSASSTNDLLVTFATPDATTSFAALVIFEITLNDAGTISNAQYANTATNVVSVSNVSDSAMNEAITGSLVDKGAITGTGWWSSSTPVNCPFFTIRNPFSNNRMRIHNLRVLRLA